MLSNLRVLDLTRLLPGPFGTGILRDLGAKVIKVEDPRLGDYLKSTPGENETFQFLNHSKEFLTLDLKTKEGKGDIFKLLENCDIFIESFRPGYLVKHGLSFEDLKKHYPRLIYCSIRGYPKGHEFENLAAHDLNSMALSGHLMDVSKPLNFQLADLAAGHFAATGILAAFIELQQTGKGKHIEISMYEAALYYGFRDVSKAMDKKAKNFDVLAGCSPCYQIYKTKDNSELAVGAIEFKFWNTFVTEVLEKPELLNSQMNPNKINVIAEIVKAKDSSYWQKQLKNKDCCVTLAKLPKQVKSDLLDSKAEFFLFNKPINK